MDLSWSDAVGSSVLIKRNSTPLTTTADDGAYTDNLGKNPSGDYSYEVCESDGSACSDSVTVGF